MLLYPDHLQNWLDYGYDLVIFLILVLFDLVKLIKFDVSRHFLENPFSKWPDVLHADVSWPLSEVNRLWLQFVDFSNFDAILGFTGILVALCGFSSLWWPFGWNWSYLGFLGFIWRTCGSKCRGEGGGIFPTQSVECCLVLVLIGSHNRGILNICILNDGYLYLLKNYDI